LPIQSEAPIKNKPLASTVVPGREHMLKRVKLSGLQPNTIAPATKITMEIIVLTAHKDSTTNAVVT
jgi:hypothetical protein